MNEACRTDLNCRSACDHELDYVLVISDTAASYDWDVENLAAFCHHADGYGLNCRA